jgi:hypothetical protein
LVSSPFAAEHDRRWKAKLKNSIRLRTFTEIHGGPGGILPPGRF